MNSYSYRKHKIVRKQDHGSNPPKNPGWVVTDGICNVAPGATWFHSLKSAKRAIDILIAIEGEKNHQLFWEIVQPVTWKVGDPDRFGLGLSSGSSCGRYSCVYTNGVISKVTVKPLAVPARIIENLRRMKISLPNLVAI